LVAFDFDGVFTDNSVIVSQEGVESVRCWRSDGFGLRKLDQLCIQTLILSTEPNRVVAVRAEKLGIECIHGCSDKSAALRQVASERRIALEQVAYVGNDINDLPCLEIVGLPIVVADAHPDVRSHAAYRTRARGGRGAVREIGDLFARLLSSRKTRRA
jgi:YrbI family 3-deoxy-D-manno-octulosonate 8-phosphate phosphatase